MNKQAEKYDLFGWMTSEQTLVRINDNPLEIEELREMWGQAKESGLYSVVMVDINKDE